MRDGRPLGSDEEKPLDLKRRTQSFALSMVRFYVSLPKTSEAQILGKQVLRSGTSIGAQYREAWRAKSDADFVSKMEGALQEADESSYWLELLRDAGIASSDSASALLSELDEITAIFVTIVKKVKARRG